MNLSGSLTGDQLSIAEGPFKLAESVALVLKSVTAGDGDTLKHWKLFRLGFSHWWNVTKYIYSYTVPWHFITFKHHYGAF